MMRQSHALPGACNWVPENQYYESKVSTGCSSMPFFLSTLRVSAVMY